MRSLRSHPCRCTLAAATVWLSACVAAEMAAHEDVSAPTRFIAEAGPAQSAAAGQAHDDEVAGPQEPLPRLEITVQEAARRALENNRAFRIEKKLRPSLQAAAADEAHAAFDTTLAAEASASQDRGGAYATSIDGVSAGFTRRSGGGTTVGVEISAGRRDTFGVPDTNSTRLGVSVTQPVLRGAGRETGLATLRQAELDVRLSEHELRGLAEALVAEVEKTYWDYVLAERQIEISRQSLKLAQKQLKDTSEQIEVGRLAKIDRAAAQAERALQDEALINAESAHEKVRLSLLRLLGLIPGRTSPGGSRLWDREVKALSEPAVPETDTRSVEEMVKRALASRPDLNQARLQVQRGELEVVKTKNGLLPRLDFFLTLGKSGYSDTVQGAAEDIAGEGYDAAFGLTFEYTLRNRAAEARHRRAVLARDGAQMAIENLEQLAELDVRTARIETERTRKQIDATEATREFREKTWYAEKDKLHVGKDASTLSVAQAQRDLAESRVAEVQAVVNHLKALVDLYRAEGTLLERRGISGP